MKTTLLAMLLLLLSLPLPAAEPAQVLLFGTFHFQDAGLDVVKQQDVDVMTAEAQAYLQGLSERLAGFRPTRVLLEYAPEEDATINQRYRDYLAGTFAVYSKDIYDLIAATEVTDQETGNNLARYINKAYASSRGIEISLVHTPGHTPGSQCFFVDDRLIAGDTLFLEGCGRTDLPGGSMRELLGSIKQKLLALPDDTIVYPGHNYGASARSTIGQEKQFNPFTR